MKMFLFIVSLVLLTHFSRAQSFMGTVSGSTTMYSILDISFTNLTGVASFNTPDDYSNGIIINNSGTIAVKSNVPWQVGVSAQSAFFQAMSIGASTNMPASVLGIRRNGTSTFLSMSTNSQTLKTGNKGNASTSGNTFDVDTKLNPGYGYNGGSYNIGLIYTISQQ